MSKQAEIFRLARAGFSCLSILAKANMLKQLKLCFRPALPAQERRKGHFAEIAGRLKRVSDGLRAMRVRLRCANRTYGGLYLHRYARRETA